MVSRFGDFNMIGAHYSPFKPLGFSEDEEVLSGIRALQPDIIWVGLSTPKQKLWMHMHMRKIGYGVGVGVGAAFNLLSERHDEPLAGFNGPVSSGCFGWVVEPRQLYKRYFFVIPRFMIFGSKHS